MASAPLRVADSDLPVLDVRAPSFRSDPHSAIAEARSRGPLARSRRGVEVLSYELAWDAFRSADLETIDPDSFIKRGAPDTLVSFLRDGVLLNMEGDLHGRIRTVFRTAFVRSEVENQRDHMRAASHLLVDDFVSDSQADLVEAFTAQISINVLCTLLGIPVADIDAISSAAVELHHLGAVPMAPKFPVLESSLETLWTYVSDLVETRRAAPEDDYISALVQVQQEDGLLSESELVWGIVNLIFAGQDTTTYQLASVVDVLLSAGVWEDLAAAPQQIPAALEEGMRLDPVAKFMLRIPKETVRLGDYQIDEGERVVINLLGAARDPEVFTSPDEFDPARAERGEVYRLPFGFGRHYCLGHALARAEMTVALEVLTERLTSVRMLDGREATSPVAMIGGVSRLPLSFTPR